MVEVYKNLFIGSDDDYESRKDELKNGWKILQAAKDPYHRQALDYKGVRSSINNPEYLVAIRDNRMILNMIDTNHITHTPVKLVVAGVEFINSSLEAGYKVLVHCNSGKSRAPSLVLLYLHLYTNFLPRSFSEAEAKFYELYPLYKPKYGIRSVVCSLWNTLDE